MEYFFVGLLSPAYIRCNALRSPALPSSLICPKFLRSLPLFLACCQNQVAFRPPQTGSNALRRQPRIPGIRRLRDGRRRAPYSAGLCGRGDWRPTEPGQSWRFCAPGLQCRFSNLRNCRAGAAETGSLFLETGCIRAVTTARSVERDADAFAVAVSLLRSGWMEAG
jgi:hypothetical protein